MFLFLYVLEGRGEATMEVETAEEELFVLYVACQRQGGCEPDEVVKVLLTENAVFPQAKKQDNCTLAYDEALARYVHDHVLANVHP